MSADPPINLNKARKARTRAADLETVARNRAMHGRAKAEKQSDAENARRAALRLDGARREP